MISSAATPTNDFERGYFCAVSVLLREAGLDTNATSLFRQAGYSYDTGPGLTADTLTLKVQYEWVADLKPIIAAANKECAVKGKPCKP